MSAKKKLNEAAQHIRDVDAQLQKVDEHIKRAQKREEEMRHPAPGLEIPLRKPGEASPGQFGG